MQSAVRHDASLHATRSGTPSQRSSEWRSSDKPRSYLWIPETTRAAALNTRCNFSVTAFGECYNSRRVMTNKWTSVVAESMTSDRRTRRSCRSQMPEELMLKTCRSRLRSDEIVAPSNRTLSIGVIRSVINYRVRQGRSDGVYRYIYTPKSVYLKNSYMVVLLLWPRTDSIWYMFTYGTLTYVLKLQWLVKTYTPKSNSWLRPWGSDHVLTLGRNDLAGKYCFFIQFIPARF